MSPRKTLSSLVRTAAILIVSIGAILSAILTFNAGHKNPSLILPALFLIWVLSPFMMLLFASYRFKRSIGNDYVVLLVVMIFLSILSVVAYTGVLNPLSTKPAAVFLLTPLISWIIIVIGGAVIKKRKSE